MSGRRRPRCVYICTYVYTPLVAGCKPLRVPLLYILKYIYTLTRPGTRQFVPRPHTRPLGQCASIRRTLAPTPKRDYSGCIIVQYLCTQGAVIVIYIYIIQIYVSGISVGIACLAAQQITQLTQDFEARFKIKHVCLPPPPIILINCFIFLNLLSIIALY